MKSHRTATAVLALVFSLTDVPAIGLLPPKGGTTNSAQYALLVGVTRYHNLPEQLSLAGGANDVLLTKDLLEKKYGFLPANVVILSEAEGQKDARSLPTRQNIERECRTLAGKVKEGDKVVVLLSGHGSRQPESPVVTDPQPDGFDKIFLPSDVSGFDRIEGTVANAITGRNWAAGYGPSHKRRRFCG